MTAQIVRPRAYVASPLTQGNRVSAESVIIQSAIDSIPQAKVTLHRGAGVKRSSSDELIRNLSDWRRRRRDGGQDTPDTSLSVHDGKGGELLLEGFVAAPALTLTGDRTEEEIMILGKDSALMSLDLSIYSAGSASVRTQKTNSQLSKLQLTATGDLVDILSEVTNVLVRNYGSVLAGEGSASSKLMLSRQHQINQGPPLQTWREILHESEVIYDAWTRLLESKEKGAYAAALVDRIATIVQTSNGSFWDTIMRLNAEFLMFYRPSYSGHGQLVRMDDKTRSNIPKTIDRVGMSIIDGSTKLLALGGVVIKGVGGESTRTQTDQSTTSHIVGYYPEVLRPGYLLTIPMPPWLGKISSSRPAVVRASANGVGDDDVYSVINYVKGQKSEQNEILETGEIVEGILNEYAKVAFNAVAGDEVTATIRMPLDLTVEPGYRLQLRTSSGDLFSAFVHGVTHQVELSAGRQLLSQTTLNLTHLT